MVGFKVEYAQFQVIFWELGEKTALQRVCLDDDDWVWVMHTATAFATIALVTVQTKVKNN